MKIAKKLPLLTGYPKSYSVGLIQIAYFSNTLKNSSLILRCFPLFACQWNRLRLKVLSNLPKKDTNEAEPSACITVVLCITEVWIV